MNQATGIWKSMAQVATGMTFEQVEMLREGSFAWRLLRAQNASLVVSFLHRAIIADNRREVDAQELTNQLDDYLAQLNEGHASAPFPRPAKEYLADWINNGWLRRFYPTGSDEPSYDVTPQAQMAIDWLGELQPQSYLSFIGTESRLITVFELLRTIVEGVEIDPVARLANLETQKATIEREMDLVREGHVTPLDQTQVRERFAQAMTIATDLLGDFRSVEQNFRNLDRSMREKISVWDKGKGELLETLFEDQDGIANSEQGKSFRSFWRYLLSQSSREEFHANLEQILDLEPVREMTISSDVRGIHRHWVEAGQHVHATMGVLNAQLRRYIDESYIAEERRILHIVRDIEAHALALRDSDTRELHFQVDATRPEVSLPQDRPLFSPPVRVAISDVVLEEGRGGLVVDGLYEQVYVNRERLKEFIDRSLQEHESVALGDVLDQHPLEQGLSEVLAYLVIAAERQNSEFPDEAALAVTLDQRRTESKFAHVPNVVFHRRREG
jgi:hypothetical protein